MKNNKKLTRAEIATRVQDLINEARLWGIDEKYYKELIDNVEQLKEPVTLAEFFGWEEDKEYRSCLGKYLIADDTLYFYDEYNRGWETTTVCLSKSFIKDLQNAKPVKEKKYYLINPEIENDWDKYLNAGLDDGKIVGITFRDKFSSTPFRAKLSEDEIEFIKSKYPKTFSVCEVVEVEEDEEKDEQ